MTKEKTKRRPLSVDAKDNLRELAGLALICGGVAAIYWPAALIVGGVTILAAHIVSMFVGRDR